MSVAPKPENEDERLAALRRYCVLDTEPEVAFDRLTRIAQHIFGVPTVLISLVDADRQWFKSRIGLSATETSREVSICSHAVYQRSVVIVPDATEDERFAGNPLVTGPPHLRFYAGAPLMTSDGYALGTLCAIDYKPRPRPSSAQIAVLGDLASAVVDALELRASFLKMAAHESELSFEREILQTTIDSISQGISTFDADLKLLAWNGKFIELMEYPRELARSGEAFASFIAHNASQGKYGPGDSSEQVAAVVANVRKFEPHKIERTRPDGRIIEIKGLPLPGGGFVSTYTDITDLRCIAEELKRRLEERERTERLKSEFVSTVSHELRTPLTAIAGMLELLDGEAVGALPQDAKEMVRVAYDNSQRLIRLINDILDIERIESGRMTFELSPLPVMPLIERAVTETKSFAQTFDIKIDIQDGVGDAIAQVDPDRFIQVVTNLLSNAIKFSPRGGAVIVGIERYDGQLRISVTDSGDGIPAEFQPRLFEKFAQADGSDTKRLAGTGLGLAIVKEIVDHLHGSVSYETRQGLGTTIHVDLPECMTPKSRMRAGELQAACYGGQAT
ncbi:MAG: PAS-domain containing protein [Pseudolabrys sp.]|nr:PAS-domain containing protein [Pseudolabrys sp.]